MLSDLKSSVKYLEVNKATEDHAGGKAIYKRINAINLYTADH